MDYIRDIQKFENAEALAAQLSEDILCVTDGASAELAVANADEQTPAQPSGQSVDDDFETELSETVEEVSETQTELAEEPVANETEQPAETETETEQPTTTETEEQPEIQPESGENND